MKSKYTMNENPYLFLSVAINMLYSQNLLFPKVFLDHKLKTFESIINSFRYYISVISLNSAAILVKASVQFSSVAQSCPTFCNPLDCSTPGFPVHHQLPELVQTHVHRVGDATQPNHLILCHPLLLLPSIFPIIRVFFNESVLHIKWPKYWSFTSILRMNIQD